MSPTDQPSESPLIELSVSPSLVPSSLSPSEVPPALPTHLPSAIISSHPTASDQARLPSSLPSDMPSNQPTRRPSSQPSRPPLGHPSSRPSMQPSSHPTKNVTAAPSFSLWPTASPTRSLPSGGAISVRGYQNSSANSTFSTKIVLPYLFTRAVIGEGFSDVNINGNATSAGTDFVLLGTNKTLSNNKVSVDKLVACATHIGAFKKIHNETFKKAHTTNGNYATCDTISITRFNREAQLYY
eukprot:gene33249-41026_t